MVIVWGKGVLEYHIYFQSAWHIASFSYYFPDQLSESPCMPVLYLHTGGETDSRNSLEKRWKDLALPTMDGNSEIAEMANFLL